MQTMPNNRSKQVELPDYAVRFIGYSARIIARKGNAEYAHLDFVSGAAAIFASEGRLLVPKRLILTSAVAKLPLCIDELKSLLKSVPPDSDGTDIVLRRGEVEICVNRGADVERLVSQLASRYWAIEPVLEQAEKIGSEIQRLPYADYIDEIAKTGVCRVVSYGDALFVDGKLVHYPERQTLLLKAIEDGRTFAIV
jgi:hypothetical protein